MFFICFCNCVENQKRMTSHEGGFLQNFLPEWGVSLVSNLGIYFILLGLGYIAVKHIRKNPPAVSDLSYYARFTRYFVFGYDDHFYELIGEGTSEETDKKVLPEVAVVSGKGTKSIYLRGILLAFCASGLLGSYLLWGILQERIITKVYSTGKFESSIFLVFSNRIFALTVASVVIRFTKQPRVRSPHYKFSFTSLSNVLSSWCQLEALKYIDFPTQVLAKSSKIIPVMIMGKIIDGKKYPCYDYVVAIVIGCGVAIFSLASDKNSTKVDEKVTTFAGIFLILGYLIFDSFTSQWQGKLFKDYKMSSYQMMFGVNSFSAFFSLVSLLSNGELFTSIKFMLVNPSIVYDILIFSTAGATGQMFIFYTIKEFGPLVFTIIMTTRQLVAIILSAIIYGHVISRGSMGGVALVFAGVIYRIYRQQKAKKDTVKGNNLSKQGSEMIEVVHKK